MSPTKIVCVAALAAALGGCAVGPNYRAPSTPMPVSFEVGPAAPASTQPASRTAPPQPVDIARWWQSLGDPELNSLVHRAIQSNLDLGIALARLQEARAGEYVVSGGALPLVDFSAGAGRGTGSDSTRSRIGGPLHSAANGSGYREITQAGGFGAAWELDLFGRFSREIEAARADTQAAAEARNLVLVSLVADVTRSYVDERALQLRLQVALQNLRTQQQTVQFVTDRFTHGLTNGLDVALSERELAAVQSTIAPLQESVARAQRRLSVLLGRMPQDLYRELQHPGNIPGTPATIQPGLPVDLLRRRPDIRQAERALAASTARIGVATANLFPRVALLGSFGFQGQGLGRAPVMDKMIWSFGPTAYWPVLDFGVLDSIVQVQNYRTRELLFNYRKTILMAVEEVDNAIGDYRAQRERMDRLYDAVTASERAVRLATQRYQRGIIDFLNVLDAQRQLYALQDQYAVAQESAAVGFVAIYKALGGGWENFQTVPPIRRPRPALLAAGAQVVNQGGGGAR